MVPLVGLQFVIVVFLDHNYLLSKTDQQSRHRLLESGTAIERRRRSPNANGTSGGVGVWVWEFCN